MPSSVFGSAVAGAALRGARYVIRRLWFGPRAAFGTRILPTVVSAREEFECPSRPLRRAGKNVATTLSPARWPGDGSAKRGAGA